MKKQPTRQQVHQRRLEIIEALREISPASINELVAFTNLPRKVVSAAIHSMEIDGIVKYYGTRGKSHLFKNARGAFANVRRALNGDRSEEKGARNVRSDDQPTEISTKSGDDKADFKFVSPHMSVTIGGKEYTFGLEDMRNLYQELGKIPGVK